MNPKVLVALRVLDSLQRIAYTSLMIYALYHSTKHPQHRPWKPGARLN